MSLSYVLAVGEAAAILIPLRGHTSVGVNADFARQNTGPVLRSSRWASSASRWPAR